MSLNGVIHSIVNAILSMFKSSDLADMPLWDDLQVGSSRQQATGPNPAQFVLYQGGVYSYRYNSGQLRETHFDLQMPHNAKFSQTVYPHIHLSKPNANAGTIRLSFEYMYANIGDVFSAPFTDTIDVDISAYAAYKHFDINFASIAPANTLSQIWLCRLARVGTNPADNYGSEIFIHSFDVHYQLDTLGSVSRTSKL